MIPAFTGELVAKSRGGEAGAGMVVGSAACLLLRLLLGGDRVAKMTLFAFSIGREGQGRDMKQPGHMKNNSGW